MNVLRTMVLIGLSCALVGCLSVAPEMTDGVVVQSTVCVSMPDPVGDKSGSFFLRRSMLCRQAFAGAVSNLVARTGCEADSLCGASICGIDENYTNGVYTLTLDVVWSEAREAAAERILVATNAESAVSYVPSEAECKTLSTWIGPKQIFDCGGVIHFLGVSAMGIGRNATLSEQNMRRAELDAQAQAVRAFMGKDMKMSDVKAVFRQVFAQRSRHPLCPNREMYVCGYEVVSLEFPCLENLAE